MDNIMNIELVKKRIAILFVKPCQRTEAKPGGGYGVCKPLILKR
jgi:hypothetical protein